MELRVVCNSPITFSCRDTVRGRRSERGFSFTELLFAVMILGIGFIMIAAIFPVGLAQTKSNLDETQAASVARGAVETLAQFATNADFIPTSGIMVPVQGDPLLVRTLLAQSNMIMPADPRYAWVALYSRGDNASAHVVVIVVNRSDPFDGSRVASNTDPYSSNASFAQSNGVRSLEPRLVAMHFEPDAFSFSGPAASDGNQFNQNAAAPGAFAVLAPSPLQIVAADLIVRNQSNSIVPATDNDRREAGRRLNGHVYRLGEDRGGYRFGVYPGSEFVKESFVYDDSASGNGVRQVTINDITSNVNAYLVGRNRTGPGNSFDGPVMDVAYYTSFITVN